MFSGPDAQRIKTHLLVWWIVWGSVLTGLCVTYFFAGQNGATPEQSNLMINLAGFAPLFISIVLRWLLLPRFRAPGPALVTFIIGLCLAETCGLLGVFVGGPYREDLFVLGVLGVAQFAPFYARRFYEPAGVGYIPNN